MASLRVSLTDGDSHSDRRRQADARTDAQARLPGGPACRASAVQETAPVYSRSRPCTQRERVLCPGPFILIPRVSTFVSSPRGAAKQGVSKQISGRNGLKCENAGWS